jgi:hypothetical protein
VAEWAIYAFPGEGLIRRVRLFHRFREHFGLEPGSLPALERFLEPLPGLAGQTVPFTVRRHSLFKDLAERLRGRI